MRHRLPGEEDEIKRREDANEGERKQKKAHSQGKWKGYKQKWKTAADLEVQQEE